jgi:hypothetical protein
MGDRVLIPLPGIGTLALSADAYRDGLAEGAKLAAAAAPSSAPTGDPLLDAEQAAAQMSVTARWLEDSARAGIIPHVKLGRFIRFRVSEIAAHCRVEGAPMPGSTDSQSVTPIRRLSRQ